MPRMLANPLQAYFHLPRGRVKFCLDKVGPMRILGLDIGDKRIGIALSDELALTAQALEVVERKKGKELERLRSLVEHYEVGTVVVGLPRNMNGSLGPQGRKVLAFAAELRRELPASVVLWDERLTTVEAAKYLIRADTSRSRRKKVIDKVAAALILQSYLDAHQKGGAGNT